MKEIIELVLANWFIVLILGAALFGGIEHLIKVAQKRENEL